VLAVLHPAGYPAERAYALRTVLQEFLGLDYVAAYTTAPTSSSLFEKIQPGGN